MANCPLASLSHFSAQLEHRHSADWESARRMQSCPTQCRGDPGIHATNNTSMNVRVTLAALTLLVCPPPIPAALFRRSTSAPAQPGSAISLRKRLHVNTLITAPGTVELEWGNDYSLTSDGYTMPATLKYTPEGRHIRWRRTA